MRARAEQLAGALERSEAALQAAEGKLGAGAEARTALGAAAEAVRAQLLEARAAAEAAAAAAAAAAAREASLGRKADETTEWAAKRVESLQVLL